MITLGKSLTVMGFCQNAPTFGAVGARRYFCLLFHSRTAISRAVPAIGRPMK